MSFGSVLAPPCHDYFFHSNSNDNMSVIYNCSSEYYAAAAGFASSSVTSDHYHNPKQVCSQNQPVRDVELQQNNWSFSKYESILQNSRLEGHLPSTACQPLKAPNKSGRLLGAPETGIMFCGKPRIVKRRASANKKERRRTLSINSAFSNLRQRIPFIPLDTKLSKIKTLRLATSYIAYLMDFLDANENQKDIPERSFKTVVTKTLETRERRKRELLKAVINAERISRSAYKETPNIVRNVNRTGWPQHVWASELGQNIPAARDSGEPAT
ncbi:transcription factor Atoh8-like [Paramacrobiotus metropolitanus]|uniref:transcription factor Atoh8-like n=1 Tax=Paramacrobiotus metropolitanus TaxID=2943436 RepID=UPI002445D2E1|nr:transcription factor Atoh8-like [Paramacrobiotus metropolitanus]